MSNIPNFKDLKRRKNAVHSFRNILVSRGGVGGTYDNKLPITPPTPPNPGTFVLTYLGEQILYVGQVLTYGE